MLSVYFDTILLNNFTNRKYLKIQEVLANLDDLFKIVVSTIKYVASFFSEYEFYEKTGQTKKCGI